MDVEILYILVPPRKKGKGRIGGNADMSAKDFYARA
jgi:hypothetical protein